MRLGSKLRFRGHCIAASGLAFGHDPVIRSAYLFERTAHTSPTLGSMQEKAAFTLMCWSLIDAMRSGEASRAQAALEALCQAYGPPCTAPGTPLRTRQNSRWPRRQIIRLDELGNAP